MLKFPLHDEILESNRTTVVPRKGIDKGILIFEVGQDEKISCFTKEQVKNFKG